MRNLAKRYPQYVGKLGWSLILLFSFLPIFLWARSLSPFSVRYANFSVAMTSLGEVTGLVAICFFAFELILSTRLKIFEDFFGGMNRVYIAHHLLGGVAFILFMVHPLVLAFSFLPVSIKSVALYLLPGTSWSINLGIIALLLAMTFLVVTYFAQWSYEIWRLTHKFLGLAFWIASIHSFFVPSDISRDPVLRTYMLVLVSLATAAYLFRTVLGRFFVKRYRFQVEAITLLNKQVIELKLKPVSSGFSFKAGQFLFVRFKSAKVKSETHPFSVSSGTDFATTDLMIKSEGDFTATLNNLTVGDEAEVEGAFGRFTFTNFMNKKQVWIAGGIGIVPFMSMARDFGKSPDYEADLYYSVKNKEEAVGAGELTKIAAANPRFRLFLWETADRGRLSADAILNQSGPLSGKDFFLCGPPPMMAALRHQLRNLGIKGEAIHSEEFSLD